MARAFALTCGNQSVLPSLAIRWVTALRLRSGQPPDEINRINLQTRIKQQLQVIEQQRVFCMLLVRDFPQQFARWETTLVVRRRC